MSEYVYLIWDHDEHGPEATLGTLDRDKIAPMISDWFRAYLAKEFERSTEWSEDRKQLYANLVAKAEATALRKLADGMPHWTEGDDDRLSLGDAWGCLHLQIVKLR